MNRDDYERLRKEDERAASYGGMVFLVLFLTTLVMSTCDAHAQVVVPDVTLPEVGETAALERGDRAPWAGMLVRDEDLFALQSEMMTTRLALENARRLFDEAIVGRSRLLTEAGAACEERVTTITALWRERRDELVAVLRDARAAAEPSWWEHPALWFALGVIVTGALTLGVVAAVGG